MFVDDSFDYLKVLKKGLEYSGMTCISFDDPVRGGGQFKYDPGTIVMLIFHTMIRTIDVREFLKMAIAINPEIKMIMFRIMDISLDRLDIW